MTDPRFDGPGPDAIYAGHLADGRFMIQRCDACALHIFHPRLLCPGCGKPNPPFVAASGDAVVYSSTVQRRKPEQGGDLNLALVDLAEGPRMMARIDAIDPHAVEIGMAVGARIVAEGDRLFVVFVPAGGAA